MEYRTNEDNKRDSNEEKELYKSMKNNKKSKVDLGNKCVHCKKDTSLGSGRFVNRYPVFGLDIDGSGIEYDGYCCDKCEQEYYKDNPEIDD